MRYSCKNNLLDFKPEKLSIKTENNKILRNLIQSTSSKI